MKASTSGRRARAKRPRIRPPEASARARAVLAAAPADGFLAAIWLGRRAFFTFHFNAENSKDSRKRLEVAEKVGPAQGAAQSARGGDTAETSARCATRHAVGMRDVNVHLVIALGTFLARTWHQPRCRSRGPELNHFAHGVVPLLAAALGFGTAQARQRPQAHRVEPDETVRVGLPIAAGLIEARQRGVVQ